jgi:hypothetical protein
MWELLGKMVPKKTVGKLYDDMFSGAAKELGKFGTDVAKTARLLLFPLQVTAGFQDRFEGMLKRIQERVPEDRQIEPPAELIGPTLEKMRYLDDRSALWSMYEEVLTKATDKEQNITIHPSFPHIIAQLSRDEAWILYRLREQPLNMVDELQRNKKENRITNLVIIDLGLPRHELYLPDRFDLFFTHLESLKLVSWSAERQDPIHGEGLDKPHTAVRRYGKVMLTDFGRLFVSACIPEHGFENHAKT